MKQEDISFCQQHIINFEAVKHGFTRNIPFDVLGRYEQMYRAYLDPQFSLTYWCGECVFDMLKRLINYYELHLVAQQNVQKEEQIAQPEMQNTIQEKKKRGRPKK
jgi:hypothetical protein